MSTDPVEPSDRCRGRRGARGLRRCHRPRRLRRGRRAARPRDAHRRRWSADRHRRERDRGPLRIHHPTTRRRHAATAHLVTNLVVEPGGADDELVARCGSWCSRRPDACRCSRSSWAATSTVWHAGTVDGSIVERAMVPEHWGDVSDHLGVDPSASPMGAAGAMATTSATPAVRCWPGAGFR